MLRAEVMTITPELAQEWLATSPGNPRWSSGKMVDKVNAQKYARDIESGDWNPGTNAIGFDEEDRLIEGHTRLFAVIEANKPIQSLVVWGITKEGAKHIDDSKVRPESQRLHVPTFIVGVGDIHNFILHEGAVNYKHMLTTEEKAQWIALHPALNDIGAIIGKTGAGKCRTKNAGCAHACMCALEYGVARATLNDFFSKVNNGYTEGSRESSAVTLKRQLETGEGQKGYSRVNKYIISLITQEAIFDFVHGVSRKMAYKPRNNRGAYFELNVQANNPLYIDLMGKSKYDALAE